jgi:DNA polymerase-3 subunit gamma/tau
MTSTPLFGTVTASDDAVGDDRPTVNHGSRTAASERVSLTSRPQSSSLYRKYRPQSFAADELVGQEHVVQTLRNAIALDRIAHAYLFCGPRGTGKTSTARLLAKAVNCLDPDPANRPCTSCANCRAITSGSATDVIEIDAASNRGIDDIRELRERVKYAPTQLRTKFYIIDEAHQITGPAANAFLKTLEEPPAHTKFILATTDPEELLPTIVSRCQRFDFRRIGRDAMIGRLQTIAEAEGLVIDADALAIVVRHATGSLRDAESLLDQLSVYREHEDAADTGITVETVRALLGISRNDRVEEIVTALADRDARVALSAVNEAVEAGEDPRQLNRQLVTYLRVLLHQRAGGTPDADERARELATRFELSELAELSSRFSDIDYKIKHSSYGHLPLEVALVEGVLRAPAAGIVSPVGATRRGASDQSAVAAPERSTPPSTGPSEEHEPPTQRPPSTSLRDRVRGKGPAEAPGQSSTISTASTTDEHKVPGTVPATPAGPPPNPLTGPPAPDATRGGGLSVEQLVDLWPRIRQDVKAVNRRIEALLSSIDPEVVQGSQITLVAAYPFHRDKLNTDEVRAVVEGTISRLIGSPVTVTCVMRGATSTATPAPASPQPVTADGDTDPEMTGNLQPTDDPVPPGGPSADPEADEQRVRAAKNIFDADEIPASPR